jgi:hypothetical protein
LKNKRERINSFLQHIKDNPTVDKDILLKALNISDITLRRYINILKNQGYEIASKKGKVDLVSIGNEIENYVLTKRTYTSMRIIAFIVDSSPCKRKNLLQHFTVDGEKDKHIMSVRNLDIHINELVEKKFIKKTTEKNKIIYECGRGIFDITNYQSNEYAYLIHYIRMKKNYSPLKDTIDKILYKFENLLSISSKISRSIEEDIVFFEKYLVLMDLNYFCECSKSTLQSFINQCRRNETVLITLKNGDSFCVVPLTLVFYWRNSTWYLAALKDTKVSLYRLDKIKDCQTVGVVSEGECGKLIEEREVFKKRVQMAFGISFDMEIYVEVLFIDHFNVVEKAKEALSFSGGQFETYKDIGVIFKGNISGAMDFLTWIRQFGSSAVILSPVWFSKKHEDSAIRTIRKYLEK